jgi:hyperosmotically inducible protein
MFRKLALVAFVLVLGPVSFRAEQAERKDSQVFNGITEQVNSYPQFTVFDDINASVDQGVVTLTGDVTMPYKRTDIEKRVAAIAGVKEVRNQIEVLPVSIYDERLRYAIARAIYGNPSFWGYAAMVNPPIHVVVKYGHVTLTGVVNNDVERVLARSLASSFGAFSVDSRLQTDAEMKALLARMN